MEVSYAALSAADYPEKHRSEEFGHGKAWRVAAGECIDPNGTIDAFPIHSFAERSAICWLLGS